MTIHAAKVPVEVEAQFATAEQYVAEYFSHREEQPEKGTITIGGERYVLVRAASLFYHFWTFIKSLYPQLSEDEAVDSAARILFDIAHGIGKADARRFHQVMGVSDPIARLSSGPIHFAYTGWAFVEILPGAQLVADMDYVIVYDHPHSFESDSWLAEGRASGRPVCSMNAGYSSGWCEESFDVPLTAKEILCRAAGDDRCRFIMAPPSRIDQHIAVYRAEHPELFQR
jgi:two-component system, cell cycle sensor histidine kinase and response regulator CckA